jgi:hypothetical protein
MKFSKSVKGLMHLRQNGPITDIAQSKCIAANNAALAHEVNITDSLLKHYELYCNEKIKKSYKSNVQKPLLSIILDDQLATFH